jgi:hypothetical protein
MNARESENYLAISRSSSPSKSVEIFNQCASFVFVSHDFLAGLRVVWQTTKQKNNCLEDIF